MSQPLTAVNHNRMTIRAHGEVFQVFKLKRHQRGTPTDMGAMRFSWFVSQAATPKFTGTYDECAEFIANCGAEYMSEHRLPV